ncbi:MAG: four helix bundle suffix domain-containing protein [Patescibacteria group bacterium]
MKKSGFENLLVYTIAVVIYDLTIEFCKRYMTFSSNKSYRTYDQMVQAARSGKQNIVEGSLEKSMEGNIKLTGVARASFGELLEDYRDFLRTKGLSLWAKEDPRVLEIRRMQDVKEDRTNKTYTSHTSNMTYSSYSSYLTNPESFANLMVTLCFKEGYLLDQLLRVQEQMFVRDGGFRENLFRKRREYQRSHS